MVENKPGADSAPVSPGGATQDPESTPAMQVLDQAVAQGGAYEVLSKRLGEQGRRLRSLAKSLNERRLAEFGSSRM